MIEVIYKDGTRHLGLERRSSLIRSLIINPVQ